MVHQHFTLADNLTVLDNVMLGTEPLWQPFTRRRAARERLLAVAQRFGLTVQPEARVGTLSVGERQRVEILKALYRDARILILDEPTAVLTPQESEALFDTLGQMVAQGLAIIFISHKLGEVLRVSHRVAVLRAGRLVAQARAADTDAATLAQWMVGQTVARTERHPAEHPDGPVVCALRGVGTEGHPREQLHHIDLDLRAGEIVAVAGVSGNGQVALAELLCGTRRASRGTLTLAGQPCAPRRPGWCSRAWPAFPKTATAPAWWATCRCGRTRWPSALPNPASRAGAGCAGRRPGPTPRNWCASSTCAAAALTCPPARCRAATCRS
jgi:simple sugar transport system ATP-binding protein